MPAEKTPSDDGSSPPSTRSIVETEAMKDSAMALSRTGTDFAVTVLVCCGLGWFADRTWGLQPWGLIGMTFVGAIVGFVNIVRVLGGCGESLGWRKTKVQKTTDESK